MQHSACSSLYPISRMSVTYSDYSLQRDQYIPWLFGIWNYTFWSDFCGTKLSKVLLTTFIEWKRCVQQSKLFKGMYAIYIIHSLLKSDFLLKQHASCHLQVHKLVPWSVSLCSWHNFKDLKSSCIMFWSLVSYITIYMHFPILPMHGCLAWFSLLFWMIPLYFNSVLWFWWHPG